MNRGALEARCADAAGSIAATTIGRAYAAATSSRLLQGLALVLAVVVLNFVLVHAAPGDPVETIAGASGGMSARADGRAAHAVRARQAAARAARRLPRRAWRTGDLGYSYFFNLPVSQMIAERVPATLLLVLSSVLLGLRRRHDAGRAVVAQAERPAVAVHHGAVAWSASRRRCSGCGIMLVILFASVLPILPVSGMRSVDSSGGGHRRRDRRGATTWCCRRSR